MNSKTWMAVLAAATVLGGCGGSVDDAPAVGTTPITPPATSTPAATTDVPASAQQSVSGLLEYLRQLIAGTTDTSEPLLVGTAVLPADETGEPAP